MSLATQGVAFGAFSPIRIGGDQMEAINLFEQQVQRRQDLVLHYRKWSEPSGIFASARTSLVQASGAGRVPVVTWEPMTRDGSIGPYTLQSIAEGVHDPYLSTWVDGARILGTPLYLRPMHEMNGNWYPWSGQPKLFVAAWQRIVSMFRAGGASNVRFVWCPNAADVPSGNAMELYWPGADFVDVIGLDGYNCYGGWRSFRAIIKGGYDRVCALDPDLPIWVCETATSEASLTIPGATVTSSKWQWIRDMFAVEGFDRVRALLWFDEVNPSTYDWRIATSQASLKEMTARLAEATGYVPAPGPYVPPTPDRVTAVPDGPGAAVVSWRTAPSFTRGYRVAADGKLAAEVAKPNTSVRLEGLTPGQHVFTVTTWTLVRTSKPSAAAACEVL